MSYLMRTLEFRNKTIIGGDREYLHTEDGDMLLDFHADTGATGLGYDHPAVRAAFERILNEKQLLHAPSLYKYEGRERVAGKLCKRAGMDKAFFCNSGAEAMEACIKLARKHRSSDDRHEIWALHNGFHGRTYATAAAGSGPPYHHEGFGPKLTGFYKWTWDSMEFINPRAAAVIVTPMLGHHDIIPYTKEQLQSIRDFCDANGILLIFDEVQCGSGRTGTYLYSQSVGVEADIIALAKGVAMGFPVGVCLARGEVADAFTPGSHFSTFGGSPPAMIFIEAMLDYLTASFGYHTF